MFYVTIYETNTVNKEFFNLADSVKETRGQS